jgi:uncharacterized protein YjbJ (UPF0337 family)
MNEMILQGKWHQVKGSVKEQWGKLTDDDLRVFLGEGEQLVGRLQQRYGYSKEQAEREVADFMESFNDDARFAEVRERSAETVRRHPWFTSAFFGGITLLIASYMLNRFFRVEGTQEKLEHQAE